MADIYFVMGVSGSERRQWNKLLSEKIHLPFWCRWFSPLENKAKMKAGIPLNDEDRVTWLATLNELALKQSGLNGAIICLFRFEKKYRSLLQKNLQSKVYWIVLIGEYDLFAKKDASPPRALYAGGFIAVAVGDYGIPALWYTSTLISLPENLIHQILANKDLAEFGMLGLGVMGKSLAMKPGVERHEVALLNQNIPGKRKSSRESYCYIPGTFLAWGYQIPDFYILWHAPGKFSSWYLLVKSWMRWSMN